PKEGIVASPAEVVASAQAPSDWRSYGCGWGSAPPSTVRDSPRHRCDVCPWVAGDRIGSSGRIPAVGVSFHHPGPLLGRSELGCERLSRLEGLRDGFSKGDASGWDYATVAYDASTGAVVWGAHYNGPGDSDDVARS